MLVNDRYAVTLDCRPHIGVWADTYKAGRWFKAPPLTIEHWRRQTNHAMDAIKDIGIDVCFSSKPNEPYATAGEMAERVQSTGVFVVRWRSPGGHPLGHDHTAFRIVHDWYGHIIPGNPFSMDGEVAAWQAHHDTKLFTKDVLPLVWSEVILENAYRLWHGHWYWHSKPVFDPKWGQV